MITNERQMAEAIFDLFRMNKCGTGHGVLMNVVRSLLLPNLNPKEKELFNTVFVGLVNTGYIEHVGTSPERMVLTQKGCDYIYDPNLQSKMLRTPWVIPSPDKTDWNKAYNRLWRIIGPTEGAICYIKGPDFYNQVMKYNEELPPTYSAYIAELRERDLSTNRADYYKTLIEIIEDEENRMHLYIDMQQLIEDRLVYGAMPGQSLDLFSFEPVSTSKDMPIVVDETVSTAIPYIRENPLTLPAVTEQNVMEVALMICDRFKELIEIHRMSELLFYKDNPQDEEIVQRLFYCVAKAYGDANDIDINRESNPGCGELDFKFSSGAHKKVIMEIKLSSNTQLKHGLTTQLPIYMEAEKANNGIFMIMRMSPNDDLQIEKIKKEHAEIPEGVAKPKLIIIDGVRRPSASKA